MWFPLLTEFNMTQITGLGFAKPHIGKLGGSSITYSFPSFYNIASTWDTGNVLPG